MNTLVYQGLHNVSCSCDLCGLPNFSSCIFDTSVILSPNVYDTFNDASFCDSNIGSPTAASSPIHKRKSHNANYVKHKRYDIPLRVLVMNCQSIKNKTANLENMIQAVQPDIIIGNESWLHDNIQSSEVFPADYNIYRKDRKSDAHGGVFILVSNKYLSSEPAELKCESEIKLLWVKIQNKGIPDLYIGSFYKPPNMTLR